MRWVWLPSWLRPILRYVCGIAGFHDNLATLSLHIHTYTTQQLHSCKGGLFARATSLSLSHTHYLLFSLYLYSLSSSSLFLNIFITLFFSLRSLSSSRTVNYAILSHFHQCATLVLVCFALEQIIPYYY